MDIFADVILYDEIGPAYDGNSPSLVGMGGSEFQSVLLLNEIAKLGKKVVCLNNGKTKGLVDDVFYLPNHMARQNRFTCDNLIVHRYSNIPDIPCRNRILWVTDLNGPQNLKFFDLFEEKKLRMACLTKYQASLFPAHWDKSVVNFIIPDWVYGYDVPESKRDFIYASSLIKGYGTTLEFWKFLKLKGLLKEKALRVCLPGYDNQVPNSIAELNVTYLGSLPFRQVVTEISMCEGMFFVNTLPETFCISAVLAEILRTPTLVYGMNGLGALPEVLNSETLTTDMHEFVGFFGRKDIKPCSPKDYRAETVMKEWKKLLGY